MVEIGTVLQNRFLIEEQIGVGGMGAVYLAIDQKFGTSVAIKETFYRDKDLAEAFEREARLLNGLHHPLFPHVSDHFTEGEGHFLVMEYIEGEDLSELLKRGERFPFETVMRWALDLLDGLDYLHSQDPPVIHRDIKPNNLKLTSRGNIVLLDFGMAKETSGNTQGMRSVFGYSRRYSPLEQIEGTGTDVRSDIFSLGATVYHLLTGAAPVDVLRRASTIVAGRPDPLEPASVINPDVPERIAALLNSALALNPDMRFASARAMWTALEHSLNGQPSAPAVIGASPALAPPNHPGPPAGELESLPAPVAFQTEVSERATAAASESDPSAFSRVDDTTKGELAKQWKTSTDTEDPVEVTGRPARIEVPVVAAPDHVDEDGLVIRGMDEPRGNKSSMAASLWGHAGSNGRSPLLFAAVPLLLLVLGLVGFALLAGDSAGENTSGETPVQQAPAPEIPVANETPEPAEKVNLPEDTATLTDEPAVAQPEKSDTPGSEAQRTSAQQRAETAAAERTSDETPPSEPRANARGREQARIRPEAEIRSNGSTRPRIVKDRVFEQPPVSSIESIMTGIPASRSTGQRNWEVLEDDQIRRERRLRRIERRNRQRWPLF